MAHSHRRRRLRHAAPIDSLLGHHVKLLRPRFPHCTPSMISIVWKLAQDSFRKCTRWVSIAIVLNLSMTYPLSPSQLPHFFRRVCEFNLAAIQKRILSPHKNSSSVSLWWISNFLFLIFCTFITLLDWECRKTTEKCDDLRPVEDCSALLCQRP